jgi:hypothetical protein
MLAIEVEGFLLDELALVWVWPGVYFVSFSRSSSHFHLSLQFFIIVVYSTILSKVGTLSSDLFIYIT